MNEYTVPWSWSFLAKPRVLALWLASAALTAYLADRRPQRRLMDQPAPQARPVLRVHQGEAQEPARVERDEDARAA